MKLPEFKLESYFAEEEFRAKHLLCASDAERSSMKDILALADEECRQLWENLILGYTETQGMPLLREEIAGLYGHTIQAENILCFAGGEEGIYCTLNALLTKEDHAIVFTPCYQSLETLPRALCKDVTAVSLKPENDWVLDIDEVEGAVQPHTKMIVMNYPHNPTGALLSKQDQDRIVDMARKHNLIIFCDEVYRYLEIEANDRLPAIADVYEKGISQSVMSKSFGLGGLRVGWLATQDLNMLNEIAAFKHYTSLCNSAPSEILTLIALRNKERIIDKIRTIMLKNLDLLDWFMEKHTSKFSWTRPRSGPICFVELLSGENSDAFCKRVLGDTGILLLPGSVFNTSGNYFRIGFGRKDFPEVLEKFESYITREG